LDLVAALHHRYNDVTQIDRHIRTTTHFLRSAMDCRRLHLVAFADPQSLLFPVNRQTEALPATATITIMCRKSVYRHYQCKFLINPQTVN
jgi:hypothetical protein